MGSTRRILGIVGEPMTAVSYVRFVQPFEHLRGLGFELATLGERLELGRSRSGYALKESLWRGVEGVVFPQMVASPVLPDGSRVNLVETICADAVRRNVRVIYSVDDGLHEMEPGNPGYETVRDSYDNLSVILANADAVLVTTPRLQDSMSRFGKPIHLLPNAVDPARWTRRRGTSGELRIGWAGSSSHIEDLLMLIPGIRRLQERIPCRFILFGLTSRPVPEEVSEIRRTRSRLQGSRRATAEAFLDLADALESIRYTHVSFVDMSSYFELLPGLDLDIGVCPLLDTPFNRHKSALKFYEYAATGTMTVASAVEPYQDEVSVVVANDPDEWCDTLERYMKDSGTRDAELERQRAFVFSERNIERLSHRWAAALEEILELENGRDFGCGRGDESHVKTI